MAWFHDTFMHPEVAGAFGSLVGLFGAPGLSIRERVFNLGAGFGCAIYMAPWLAEYMGMETLNGKMMLAFTAGLVGMNLVAKVLSYARHTSLERIINSVFGPKTPTQ